MGGSLCFCAGSHKHHLTCLQELKTSDDKYPEEAIKEAGFNSIWHGQKSWNGVAILTKEGLLAKEVQKGLTVDPEDIQSRYIHATIRGIRIVCLYLPNGNPAPGPRFDYKMAWLNMLSEHARKLLNSGGPVIMTGDFNVVPTDLDAYKPERWVKDAVFFPEPREVYQKLLDQGWVDAIRTLYPEEKIFTYWDYFRNAFSRDAGIRMDHFLLSPDLSPRLKSGGVDREVRGWEKTSDHAPVWIELKD